MRKLIRKFHAFTCEPVRARARLTCETAQYRSGTRCVLNAHTRCTCSSSHSFTGNIDLPWRNSSTFLPSLSLPGNGSINLQNSNSNNNDVFHGNDDAQIATNSWLSNLWFCLSSAQAISDAMLQPPASKALVPQLYCHHLVFVQGVKVLVPVWKVSAQCQVPLNDFPRSQLAEFRRAQVSQQVRGG